MCLIVKMGCKCTGVIVFFFFCYSSWCELFNCLSFSRCGFCKGESFPLLKHTDFFSNIVVWNHMGVRSLSVLCHSCKNNLCSRSPFLSLAPPILARTGSSVAAALELFMSYCKVSAIIGDKSLLCLWLLLLLLCLWLLLLLSIKCPRHSNSSLMPLKLRSCLASVSLHWDQTEDFRRRV